MNDEIDLQKEVKIATIFDYMGNNLCKTYQCDDSFGTDFDNYYFKLYSDFVAFTESIESCFLSDDFGVFRKEFYFDGGVNDDDAYSCYALSHEELDMIIHAIENNEIKIEIRRVKNQNY